MEWKTEPLSNFTDTHAVPIPTDSSNNYIINSSIISLNNSSNNSSNNTDKRIFRNSPLAALSFLSIIFNLAVISVLVNKNNFRGRLYPVVQIKM